MAFEVLFNLLTNAKDLRAEIGQIRQDSQRLTQEQIAAARKMQDEQQQLDRIYQDTYKRRENLLKQEEGFLRDIAKLEKNISDQREQYAAKAQVSEKAKQRILAGQNSTIEGALAPQKQNLALLQSGLDILQKQIAARKIQLETYQQEHSEIQKLAQVQQRNFQDQQQQNKARALVLENQAQQVRATQQSFAGASYVAAASGIPGIQQLGTLGLAYSFGGPQAAAMTAVAGVVTSIVKGISGAIDLTKELVTSTYEYYTQLETSRIAIAGIIAQTTVLVDKTGNLIPEEEKFAAALRLSSSLQQDMLSIVLRTNITLSEAAKATQTSLGALISRGVDPKKAQEIVITLASVAKSIGVQSERVGRDILGLFEGYRNRLSILLQQAGVSIKDLSSKTGPELQALLEVATNQLHKSVDAQTDQLRTQLINIKDTFQTIFALGFGDAAAAVSARIQKLLNMLYDTNSGITAEGEKLRQAAKELFDQLARIVEAIATPANLTAFTSALTGALGVAKELLHIMQEIANVALPQGLGNALQNIAHKLEFRRSNLGAQESGRTEGTGRGLYELARDKGLNEDEAKNFVQGWFSQVKLALQKQDAGRLSLMPLDAKAEEQIRQDVVKSLDYYVSTIKKESTKKDLNVPGIAFNKSISFSNTELHGEVDNLTGTLSKINAAIALLKRVETPAEQAISKQILEATKSGDALVAAQKRKELQDLQTKLGYGINVIVPGAQSPEEARMHLEQAREQIINRISALQSRREGVEATKAQTAEINRQIDALGQQKAALLEQIEAEQNQASQEARVTAIRIQLRRRLESADASLQDTRGKEVAQSARVAEAQKAYDDLAVKLKSSGSKAIDISNPVNVKLQNELSKLANDRKATVEQEIKQLSTYRDELQRVQADVQSLQDQQAEFGAKLKEEVAAANARSFSALGIAGANLQAANLEKDLEKVNAQFVRQGIEIQKNVDKLKGEEALATELAAKAELAKLPEAGPAREVARLAGQAVLNAHLQLEETIALFEVYKDIAIIQREMLQIRLQEEQLAAKELDTQARIGLITAQQNVGQLGVLSAYNQIRSLQDEQIKIEEERQVILTSQALYLERQAAALAKQLSIGNLTAAEQDQLRFKLAGILQEQNQISVAITNSRTKATQLVSEFSSVGKSIVAGTAALAQFFNQINLPVIGAFFDGISKIAKSVTDIGKSGGLGGFFSEVGKIFKDTKEQSGGGIFGSLAGIFASVSKVVPIVSGIVQGALQIFNFVSTIFTAAARHLRDDIKKSVDDINSALQTQAIDLNAAIDELQQQRQRTFELQSKKGGYDDAVKLRQQIDSQLSGLQQQQRDILRTFNQEVAVFNLGGGFKDLAATLADAAKKVQDFLGAGGSVATAQQYLNGILHDFDENLLKSISSEQQNALQQASDLIDLHKQLNELDSQHQQTVNGILAQGLVARELTFGQQKAQQLAQETKSYNEQHQKLLDQIAQTKALLDINKEVLAAGTDLNNTEAIKLQLIHLQVEARQKELDIVKQQMQIAAGILKDSSGNFLLSPDLYNRLQAAGLFTSTNVTVASGAFQFTISIQPGTNGEIQDIQNQLADPNLTDDLRQSLNDLLQRLLFQLLASGPQKSGLTIPLVQP